MPVSLNDRILLYLENCAYPLVVESVDRLPGSVVGPNFLFYYGDRAEKLSGWARTIDGAVGEAFRADSVALVEKVSRATEMCRLWQSRMPEPVVPPGRPVPEELEGLLKVIWTHVRISRRLALKALKTGLPDGVELYRSGMIRFLSKGPRAVASSIVLGALTL